ncbi:hypothetical protein [Bacillus rubiinfantis]|uniref:hypothetical protein n=1 Tax=Bacillus rubiinfantis TaxID=1499680 RepID=UPI0005A64233|nr:hypothetical protein [Bacillus rubiinfantis]
MNKETLLAIICFFLVSMTTVVYAVEDKNKPITISEQKADISGDGKLETIFLKGVPYEEDKSFLQKIYLEVITSNEKTYTFPLESGTKAALQLIDMNDDGVRDLFATVQNGENSGTVFSFIYSLKNFKKVKLPAPESVELESRFLNNYQAEIKMKQTGKTYYFDLSNRKNYYQKLGLYYKGRLNEPTELMVQSFQSLKPTVLQDGRLGLKGIQRVAGIANGDTIAYIESNWQLQKGKWRLANLKVVEGNNS